MTPHGVILGCVTLLCGCASTYAPAVLVEQTALGQSELVRIVAQALHTERVVLADDALTTDSSLIVERTPARDARGLPLNGRERSRPESFQLYVHRGDCVLRHPKSGRHWELRGSKCRPAVNNSR